MLNRSDKRNNLALLLVLGEGTQPFTIKYA